MRSSAQIALVALAALGCTRRPPQAPASAPAPEPVRATMVATDSAPGVIRGVVRDSASGAPIAGVGVWLIGWQGGVTTDTAGRFALPAHPPGGYLLRAHRLGYESFRVYLTVAPEHGVAVDVRLPQRSIRLESGHSTGR